MPSCANDAPKALDLSKDALGIVCDLIRYPSVTPLDCSSLDHILVALTALGWEGEVHTFHDTKNLYVRWGKQGPHLCFAGHVDVVPPGDEAMWIHPPFAPTLEGQWLYGRGVADMKGAIGCFLSAVTGFLKDKSPSTFPGSVSILLTSDEEGPGTHGIKRMVPILKDRGEAPDLFLIGEPTGSEIGDVLQVGRRGSLVSTIEVHGVQGHIAYPDLANNPIPRLVRCVEALMSLPLDDGDAYFQPSRLELTSIDTGNTTENMIPSGTRVRFGIRFNTRQDPDALVHKIEDICKTHALNYTFTHGLSGLPFVTTEENWIQRGKNAMSCVTHKVPQCSTSGGTTDGRFLCALAPILEIGFPETTIHQINERILIQDVEILKNIYLAFFREFYTAA